MAIIRVCQTTKTFDHHMMVEVAGHQDGYFAQKILLMRPAFAHYFWLRITRSRTLKRRIGSKFSSFTIGYFKVMNEGRIEQLKEANLLFCGVLGAFGSSPCYQP